MVDVTIIIVNYNGFNFLKKCLSTLYEFTRDLTFEVIIIDNNSSEGKIEEVLIDFKDVILIKNETNIGFSKANNLGLKIARGKYVLFLNNDVYFIENSIKKIFDFSEKQNDRIIVGCKLLNPDGSWQASTSKFPSLINLFSSNFFLYVLFPKSSLLNKYFFQFSKVDFPIKLDYVLGAFLFGLREDFLKLGGFDERFFFYAEDIDLCFRFLQNGGSIFFFPNTSVFHIGGGSVRNIPWFKIKNKFISEIQFYQKHFSGIKFVIAIIISYIGDFIRIPIFFFLGLICFNKNYLLRSFYHIKLLFVYPKNLFKDKN